MYSELLIRYIWKDVGIEKNLIVKANCKKKDFLSCYLVKVQYRGKRYLLF
jgi:hypothetical protein